MAKEGIPFILAFVIAAVVVRLLIPGSKSIPVLLIFLAAFTAYFFRDPERTVPDRPNVVISPADGKVVYVGEGEKGHYFEGPAKKVSIFMSILDVHVNRSPVSGVVREIIYNRGKFFNANSDKASLSNEQNWVIMEKSSQKIAFVQIAGLVARRIVCKIAKGQSLDMGQKVGLIMFGSRIDLYLPQSAEVTVTPGMKVRAGESVIGEL
ncbi:MAG: phosphatidylserine decarboxylase family protein [Deltaproteobacteria bacterium]|nr:phosphatidylserine decarboxylase family protein [Deltaproteobacteria bacterium]NIS78586.1 phosphatidylserine decarboxylase family protein [Deltaproteobacteria bacterium]